MPKITFMGAGSTIFAKNVLGDCMCRESLKDSEIALYDIDAVRLKESKAVLDSLNANINSNRAKIKTYLGVPLEIATYTFLNIPIRSVFKVS